MSTTQGNARTFEYRPAVREQVPLMIGLVGPSGSGKTYSALRLASGIQRIGGGDIAVIDTESRRALHYAKQFKFKHVPFGAPFSPLDYLAAIEHCVKQGAKTIIVDSTSHEHEGPGGVLEMHEAEVNRLSHGDASKAERVKMLAWSKPKAQRRRLINTILQLPINAIFCFRAKEKLKIERGKEPSPLGWMPIAGDEFVYEMTLNCIMLPGANGVPSWGSEFPGEKAMMKCPEQFRGIFGDGPQLTEDIGEALARWAAGDAAPNAITAEEALTRYAACSDAATLRTLDTEARGSWAKFTAEQKTAVTAAKKEAKARVDAAAKVAEQGATLAATGTDGPTREPGDD